MLRDEDRDISEKIALGQTGAAAQNEDNLLDQRLFNQTQGMDSGFAAEDDYTVSILEFSQLGFTSCFDV